MSLVQSHRCDIYGCTIKKPFDTIEDLEAHFATSHEPSRPHRCPVETCARHRNGFTTSANLIEHIKTEHDPPKCTFDHCDFRSFGSFMFEHCRKAHWRGFWECTVLGCEGSKSKFTFDRFKTHLWKHHDITELSYEGMCAVIKSDKSYFEGRSFGACKHCSGSKAQSNQEEVLGDDTAWALHHFEFWSLKLLQSGEDSWLWGKRGLWAYPFIVDLRLSFYVFSLFVNCRIFFPWSRRNQVMLFSTVRRNLIFWILCLLALFQLVFSCDYTFPLKHSWSSSWRPKFPKSFLFPESP